MAMKFTNVGKTHQLIIENGNDLAEILNLDEALWGATAAPAGYFKCDPQFIHCMDPDKTGRINSNGVKVAIRWLLDKITDPANITPNFDGKFPLSQLNEKNAAGLLRSAQYVLSELDVADKNVITLDQTREFLKTVTQRPFNGDGVISVRGAALVKGLSQLVDDVVATTGGSLDVDGTQGASGDNIAAFLAAAKEYQEWFAAGVIPEGETKTAIMPFGAETAAVAAAVNAAAAEVERFFKLSGTLGFDGRIEPKTMTAPDKLDTFDPADDAVIEAYLDKLPLAQPNRESKLTLELNAINPKLRALWNDVITKAIRPILGEELTEITPEQWNTVLATIAPYNAYIANKKGAMVESIPLERLHGYTTDEKLPAMIADTAARDQVVTEIVNNTREVEKLLLFRTLLLQFVNNFVAFSELYDLEKHAMFECGSLVIDGRWFNMALDVANTGAHKAVAQKGLLCIIYVAVKKPTGTVNYVFPVTYGSKGNLHVGKRGVFFDWEGKEYDATIIDMVSNPVCFREALLAPFTKISGLLESKIESLASTAEKSITDGATKAINQPIPPAPPAKPASDKGGMLLGASVAVAALGSAFAFISKTLSNMSTTSLVITIICALLVVLAPISIMAIVKLRKQDLSALLEGSEWAINLLMRLTKTLRRQFTNFGKYPADAEGAPRPGRFLLKFIIVVIIIVAAFQGVRCYQNHLAKKQLEFEKREQAIKEEHEMNLQHKKEAEAAEKKAAETAQPAPAVAPAQ